jgi:tripeptide aminopeptidase
MSGAGVKPIVHHSYDGRDLALPDDPGAVLRPADSPYLAECVGHDIVTASGTTLLGADNKSGVAAIMTAADRLMARPDIPHGAIKIAFTPDEEVGQGTRYFDVARFGARYAYTMDGGPRGELEFESFSADAITLAFRGFNTHPGFAKGRMVNAVKLAARFIDRLPPDRLSPETTEGREGFVHPYVVHAGVDRTAVRLIVRDFDTAGLGEKEAWLQQLAEDVVSEVAGASVEVQIDEQYRNMREVIDHHPEVVERAREAIGRAGLRVRERAIRGGTDGSRLSFMGLPTPNVFAGEQNFHSRLEWVSVQDMEKAVDVIVEIARVWEERA